MYSFLNHKYSKQPVSVTPFPSIRYGIKNWRTAYEHYSLNHFLQGWNHETCLDRALHRDFSPSSKQLHFANLTNPNPNKRVQVQLGNLPRIYSSTCTVGVIQSPCQVEYTCRPEVEQICIIRTSESWLFSIRRMILHQKQYND